jgi:dolichol-phosphate mannosyltransferase
MIYFIVPAYNEEDNIQKLIEETHITALAHKWEYRLIVVDDGSHDRTAEQVRESAKQFVCEVISYQPNRGVGEAFRRGLNYALSMAKEGDWIVTKEADGTSDLSILPAMIQKIEAGADAVLASCYADQGSIAGTSLWRIFLSKVANFVINTLFHIRGIHTYSSFYRIYKPKALRAVVERYGDFYKEPGFACVIELLIRLSKLRLNIQEEPMVLQASKRIGNSKMKVFQTMLGYARVISRHVFN